MESLQANSPAHQQSPGFRFSLRWLLAAVALCAIAITAMLNASHFWIEIISSATLLAFLVALLTAVLWSGQRRAFAIGFLAWGVTYAVLTLWSFPGNYSNGKLITSELLEALHPHVARQIMVQTVNSTGTAVTVPSGQLDPDWQDWMQVGQLLWTWLFAICGGFIAQAMWRRRPRAATTTK